MDFALVADVHLFTDRVAAAHCQDFSRSVDREENIVIRCGVQLIFCIPDFGGDVAQVKSISLDFFAVCN